MCTATAILLADWWNSLSLLIGDEHGVIPVCAYDEDIVTTEQLDANPGASHRPGEW